MNNLLLQVMWWAVPVIILLLMYKFVLRVFFGMVIVPDDRIGLVVKKYVLSGNKRLPDGRIIAINGEAGMQAKTLAPGLYWGIWALIQARISEIDFDYSTYAEERLGEYFAWRAEADGTRVQQDLRMPLRERRWAEE